MRLKLTMFSNVGKLKVSKKIPMNRSKRKEAKRIRLRIGLGGEDWG